MSENPAVRPSRIPWPPILLGAALLGSWLLGRILPLPWPGLDDLPARIIGLSIGAAGVALTIWAAITLQRHYTTILPHRPASALITSGPFAYLRNPLYLGDVMILLGLAELTRNVWFVILALVFAVLVTWLAILPEERHLEARFGRAYRDYMRKARRWI